MSFKLLFYVGVLIIAILGYRTYNTSKNALQVGDFAPDFSLEDVAGQKRTLKEFAGHYTVLYFYPKDNTPGCTKEACLFRDDIAQLEKLGAKVVGISVDTAKSHGEFSKKHKLPFPLLADTDGKVAASYQALNNFFIFKIAKRHTFLIDPQGRIARIYRSVDVSKHSQQIIDDLKMLESRQ